MSDKPKHLCEACPIGPNDECDATVEMDNDGNVITCDGKDKRLHQQAPWWVQ